MADKEDNLELTDVGEEDKLVDDETNNNSESVDKRPKSTGSVSVRDNDDEGEDTADLDEEQDDEDGDDEDDDNDDEEVENENNDIVYTNIDSESKASTKVGFFEKLKRKLGVKPKIHGSIYSEDSSTITIKYVPPPAPRNMPSARDAARARIFRKEKVRYGKEKMEFYLEAFRADTIVVDDLVMRSEQNVAYVKGI